MKGKVDLPVPYFDFSGETVSGSNGYPGCLSKFVDYLRFGTRQRWFYRFSTGVGVLQSQIIPLTVHLSIDLHRS